MRASPLILCLALPLTADPGSELRATLQRLRGSAPVRAAVHLREWQRTLEGKQPVEQGAEGDFQVADGPSGLSLTVQPGTAERVKAEALLPAAKEKRDRPALRPVTSLVSSFGPLAAGELVNAALPLLALLEGAVLKEDRADASLGPSARMLGFQRPGEEQSKAGAKAKTTGYLKVWLGANGVPIASQQSQGFEVGFMWIKAKGQERVFRRYLLEDGRLLVTEELREQEVEGAGEEVRQKRTLTLALAKEPPR